MNSNTSDSLTEKLLNFSNNLKENTPIYTRFMDHADYTPESKSCIRDTVEKLLTNKTNVTHPGMLLGKIQSGKTRTFIGIIALAFDKNYDICVVFTKGTRALTEQTFHRLESEFRNFIDTDEMKVYDIMNIPNQLTHYIRKQKLIIIVKKQTHNLDRLLKLFKDYGDLAEKKVLFIDDEADIASVGFKKDKTQQDGVSINVLANKLNNIRTGFDNNYGFLQVTATPYSLYLQPEGEVQLNNIIIKPNRPTFTSLVPIHKDYIGGKEYFELSKDPNSVYSHLHVQVPDDEIAVLKKPDQRYISNILTTPNLRVFRQSIINYLVAGAIRIIQNKTEKKIYKSSFIIHILTTKNKHQWQIDLTESFIEKLSILASKNDPLFLNLLQTGYDNLILSIRKNQDIPPNFSEVSDKVKECLMQGMIGIIKINSENEIAALLDRKGQLRLDNPFNIFIGGQILDRGLTIENLIGFFYGRNPSTFQQDTVLQHSRMYGSRAKKDVAVTRLYTSNRIYRALSCMHDFDTALRDAFERGVHNQDDGVIFLEKDSAGSIRPCAPNKILITSTETIRPYRRYLPYGFQTKSKTLIQKIIYRIDQLVNKYSNNKLSNPFLIDLDTAIEIVNLIDSTFEYDERFENVGDKWNKHVFIAILRRLVDNISAPNLKNKVYCYAQTGRNISRLKNNNTAFTDAPDDGQTDIPIAKSVAVETPCLILLRQNGLSANGWRDCEFWWPILFTPANTKTAVFASETIS